MAKYVVFAINGQPYVLDAKMNTVHKAERADQATELRIMRHLTEGKLQLVKEDDAA